MTATVRLACRACTLEFERRWPMQRYCSTCQSGQKKEAARKSSVARAARRSVAISEIRASRDGRSIPILNLFDRPEYLWTETFSVDFHKAGSKNARFNFSRMASGPSVTRAVSAYQEYIAFAAKRAVSTRVVVQNRLYISMHVQKPSARFDAINLIDTVADAVRDGIGLDDKWFCIDQVNWSIVKTNPQIIIKIGQCSQENVISCTHCGEVKGVDAFGLNKTKPFGRAIVCKECRSAMAAPCSVLVTACERGEA